MTNTVTITSAINHPDQWQVQGENADGAFTEDGPFATLDEARAAVANHAVSCGFSDFDLQVNEDAVNINNMRRDEMDYAEDAFNERRGTFDAN